MGWIGGAIGYAVGSRFGALAGILGAVIGSGIADFLAGNARSSAAYGRARPRTAPRGASPQQREVVFLTAVGAMLAKLAKADGHVDESEIAAAEQAFVVLGLTPEKRAICVRAFRAAKTDPHSIFDYAESFASVTRGVYMRELMYDILWDMACADGEVSPDERRILEMIVTQFRIRPSLFAEQRSRRVGARDRSDHRFDRRSDRRTDHGGQSPYDILGCAPTATDDELRRAYRSQAKKHHPDLLRAQGLPDEMVSRANEQMARINEAWEEIKRARGIF